MNLPLFPDEWRTNWHLAGHVDKLGDGGSLEVTVAGVALEITSDVSGLSANGDGQFPVMVVDDGIFVLLGDGPE